MNPQIDYKALAQMLIDSGALPDDSQIPILAPSMPTPNPLAGPWTMPQAPKYANIFGGGMSPAFGFRSGALPRKL